MAFYKSSKIHSFGLSLGEEDPHIDINQFNGMNFDVSFSLEDYVDSMIWSDKMTDQSISISSFYFHLYDFSICGHTLLGTFSTHYPAVISTTSKCLSVPREVFDNLRGWLLLDCPANGTPGRDRLCYLGEVWKRGTFKDRAGITWKHIRRSSFDCKPAAQWCESR